MLIFLIFGRFLNIVVSLEESEISEHCFDLIFAFDEIVALGYRENVNLAQNPDIYRDGLSWGKGVPCRQRGRKDIS